VVWVNITSARNPKLTTSRHDTLFYDRPTATALLYSLTVGKLHRLYARWAAWRSSGRADDDRRVSPYNAVGNAAAAACQLLEHSSELQLLQATLSVPSPHPPPQPPPVAVALNETNLRL